MASVLEEIRYDFIGMNEAGFNTLLAPISKKVSEHIGQLSTQQQFEEVQSLSHMQVAQWVGQAAIRLMPSTSMRSWVTTIDNSSESQEEDWAMAVWMLIHVLPLGFLVSNHRIGSGTYAWNPSQSPIKKGAQAKYSNRPMDGLPISLGVCLTLFPDMFAKSPAMLNFAMLNMFSSHPNSDNPFYNSFRDALRQTLIRYPYPIPFFWIDWIERLFAYNPVDLSAFKASLAYAGNGGFQKADLNKYLDDKPTANNKTPEAAETVMSEPNEPEQSVSSIDDYAQIDKASNEGDGVIVPDKPKEEIEAKYKDQIEKWFYQWGSSIDDKQKQNSYMRNILESLALIANEEIDKGHFVINGSSAFAYTCSKQLYVTEGGMTRWLNHATGDMSNMHNWLSQHGVIKKTKGTITVNSKEKQITVYKLHGKIAGMCLSESDLNESSDVFSVSDS
jgi:hypothetical protein